MVIISGLVAMSAIAVLWVRGTKPTTTVKVLWAILMLAGIVYQALAFVRLRREHVQIFHSTGEMVLVAALFSVALIGVFVKSRKRAS